MRGELGTLGDGNGSRGVEGIDIFAAFRSKLMGLLGLFNGFNVIFSGGLKVGLAGVDVDTRGMGMGRVCGFSSFQSQIWC
jgi:hypothetical protein